MVNRLEKGFAPLCFIQEGKLICYKRGCLWVLAGNKVLDKYPIFNSAKEFLIGAINPFSRLLRLGIRASIALDENRVFFLGEIIFLSWICCRANAPEGILSGKACALWLLRR